MAAFGVDHVVEEEGLAVGLGNAAAELPAHQWVQLGVLVDLAVNRDEQAGAVEFGQVFVQVAVAAFGFGRLGRLCV